MGVSRRAQGPCEAVEKALNAHQHRYGYEFDFQFFHRTANGLNDNQRTRAALRQIVGKRLSPGPEHRSK
jgi:hypothetical protein